MLGRSVILENVNGTELLDALNSISERLAILEQKATQPQESQPKEDFLTQKQVAQLLNINVATVWAWTNSGKLIKHRIGKRVYYKRSDIETLINQSKIGE